MFLSAHYSGEDLVPKFAAGEQWKKVFGPVFMYANSAYEGDDPLSLWEDAKSQVFNRLLINNHIFFNLISCKLCRYFIIDGDRICMHLTLLLLQMMMEVQCWPYSFPASEDFPKSHQRGSVSGRLLIRDR